MLVKARAANASVIGKQIRMVNGVVGVIGFECLERYCVGMCTAFEDFCEDDVDEELGNRRKWASASHIWRALLRQQSRKVRLKHTNIGGQGTPVRLPSQFVPSLLANDHPNLTRQTEVTKRDA